MFRTHYLPLYLFRSESAEALGEWNELIQEYEHGLFSKTDNKPNPSSPTPSEQSLTQTKGGSKRRVSATTRPSRPKAKGRQYYEGDDSDDSVGYIAPRQSRRSGNARGRKPTGSSGDDGGDDQDASSTGNSTPNPNTPTTQSARGYPRRAAMTVKPQQRTGDSSDDSSAEASTPKRSGGGAGRKPGSASAATAGAATANSANSANTPKSKRVIAATSTDASFVQAHHPFCTRCGQKGETVKRKSKKPRSDDEDDDEPLGALLLCECCSMGYHRGCLRKTYHESLVGTGFRCEPCIKLGGAECQECHGFVGKKSAEAAASSANSGAAVSTAITPSSVSSPIPSDTTPAVAPQDAKTDSSAEASITAPSTTSDGDVLMEDASTGSTTATPATDKDAATAEGGDKDGAASESPSSTTPEVPVPDVLFRCFRCSYTAHDHCLRRPKSFSPNADQASIVRYYRKDWKCHQCLEWDRDIEAILAFRDVPIVRRSDPANQNSNNSPSSASLPDGENKEGGEGAETNANAMEVDSVNQGTTTTSSATTAGEGVPLGPEEYADVPARLKEGQPIHQPENTRRELLIKWKGLSYRKVTWVPSYWVASVVTPARMKSFWKKTFGPATIEDVVPKEWTEVETIIDVVFEEDFDGGEDDMDAKDYIQSVFVKWKGLDYEHSTWDEPDDPDDPDYENFKQAYRSWAASLKIEIPMRAKKGRGGVLPRPHSQAPFAELKEQPSYVSGGRLKDYQMDGLNWLRYNHWQNVNSILADEMGLGKTIQMVAFINTLYHELHAFPCLVVVPNSTLTNWVREFAKWSPDLRVVAYYGPQQSRAVVRDYEMFHRGTQDLKCHVVVTTYEMIVNPVDGALFRRNAWECLVVDEGQRLKNENSQLFVKLNELAIETRVLLTGTPLQNNIRELFSLMNFLDPVKFADVTELEKKYENLDKEAVEELHSILKPFFLRRTKDEVLKDLPPKSEVIVPVGMSPLQKEIYKGILARNHKLLQSITNRGGSASTRKASLHNILMELRKCLNHPYLIEGVEPRDLATNELVHKSLIEAGSKLELLHAMLPKLKAAGHRVLIFSTMTRLLDILEDYLHGERYSFVRLDGSTSSADRQARIDKYNAPGSEVFIFLLSTRAGGVGVNLATADTIIIYDADFNPKADMQALSRAHRIGQTKKVLVLKLMTRNSAEERIVQIGKKKMILDHLIVERMEDDNLDPTDVESILKFGAKALFEEDDASTNEDNLKYDDAALDALLDRSKIERSLDESGDNGDTKVGGFGFAKVWTETKGLVDEDMPIDPPAEDEDQGFWTTLLKDRLAMLHSQEEELLGRGARRKTVMSYAENGNHHDSPPNKKRKAGKDVPNKEEEEYQAGVASVSESEESGAEHDPDVTLAELEGNKRPKKVRGLAASDANYSPQGEGSNGELMDGGASAGGDQDGLLPVGPGGVGRGKKLKAGQTSPNQMLQGQLAGARGGLLVDRKAGGGAGLGVTAGGRKVPLPCVVCQQSHRDRCSASYDVPLVLERRQQIVTSNIPDQYKAYAVNLLDSYLVEKNITPAELPRGRAYKNLSAAAARLGGAAYNDNLRSMSIGKAYKPTITPGACIVCNQTPYHLPFKCPEAKNVVFMQERCRAITLDPTLSDAKKQEYVATLKNLIARESPQPPAPRSLSASAGMGGGAGGGGRRSSSHLPSSASAMGMGGGGNTGGSKHDLPPGPGISGGSSGNLNKANAAARSMHAAYSSQVPPQFLSSRPANASGGGDPLQQHRGSVGGGGSGGSGGGFNDAYGQSQPSQRKSVGGDPHAPPSTRVMTSGARESYNYQPRRPAYRAEDGSIVTPGPLPMGHRGSTSSEPMLRERERERDHREREALHRDQRSERGGGYPGERGGHPGYREDPRDLPSRHSQGHEYARDHYGPLAPPAAHERPGQGYSGSGGSQRGGGDRYGYGEPQGRSSQLHLQSHHHAHQGSAQRPASLSPRDEHRGIAVPSSHHSQQHGSHPHHHHHGGSNSSSGGDGHPGGAHHSQHPQQQQQLQQISSSRRSMSMSPYGSPVMMQDSMTMSISNPASASASSGTLHESGGREPRDQQQQQGEHALESPLPSKLEGVAVGPSSSSSS
ncbi:hypothetical protein BGZ73_004402, partial [Actinomortierella ambigua]